MMSTFIDKTAEKLTPFVLLFTRLVVGYLFLIHGTVKLFEFPFPNKGGAVSAMSILGVGGILEVVGGILIALGLFTRFTGFILAGLMAVAYFFFHASLENWLHPIVNRGELASIYCMVFLIYMVIGPGKWSLDEWLKNRNR